LKFIMIYTTLPDKVITKKIATILTNEGLVACVNFFSIESVYKWKGKLSRDKEYALIMKTRKSLYKKIEKRLKELHPYEVPAIVSYEIKEGLNSYLSWIKKETQGKERFF
jgi:periplasmic divalent cation tolerance protein